jgi:ABC-2 type transport system permease protein
MSWNAFLWSLRREWWENRAIYIAPLIIAAGAFAGYVYFGMNHLARMGSQAMPDPRLVALAGLPYGMAASIILLTGWIVGIFYAADALYGDRRDRSILFWKSMPVSDLATVTAKMCIPLLVIPAFGLALTIAAQLLMLATGSLILAATGGDPGFTWRSWPMVTQTIVMSYGVFIHALWFAPVYAWLLLVSSWAKRAVLLWAFLPILAMFALEKLALGTSWLASAVQYRIMGAMTEGFAAGALKHPVTQLSQLDPVRFLSTPNLWLGLAFAGACFALAVRLRRFGEPT